MSMLFRSGIVSRPSGSTGEAVFVPGVPTGVTATGGDAKATVSWTAPASDGGSAITGYVVYTYRQSDNGQVARVAVGTATSFVQGGLTNGTTYYFKVAAKNAVGEGSKSLGSNFVTPQAAVVSGTVNPASVHSQYYAPDASPTTYRAASQRMLFHNDPAPNPGQAAQLDEGRYGWFASSQGGFINGGAYYMGLQVDSDVTHKRARCSVWDAFSAAAGPGCVATPFGGEGVGYTITKTFEWVPNHVYDFRMFENGADTWIFRLVDLTDGWDIEMGSFIVPSGFGRLITRTSCWTEWYSGPEPNCDCIPFASVSFAPPKYNWDATPVYASHTGETNTRTDCLGQVLPSNTFAGGRNHVRGAQP